ncbi:MAG: hypothetical protein Q9169_008509 [Polycauliona sp. 2 TL-2023]
MRGKSQSSTNGLQDAKVADHSLDENVAEVQRDVTVLGEIQGRDVQAGQVSQIEQDNCRRLQCPPWSHLVKSHGICRCKDNKVKLARDTSSLVERDVQAGQVSQIEQDNCRRLQCPPWGHLVKSHGICRCKDNKVKLARDIPSLEDRNAQVDSSDSDEPLDCASIAKCPGGQHPVNNASDGMCECVDDPLDCASIAKCPGGQHPVSNADDGMCECVDDSTYSLVKRNAQTMTPNGEEPLDCASIARCPGGQHPANNASDGMCECVDDDNTPATMDCASIAKCPLDQHPVFNNSSGMCQCIDDDTQLDCEAIAKCADGAHPVNYDGQCICVLDKASL